MRFSAPLTTEQVEPALQRIEVASSLQIPSFHIVGLASQEVSEARERIRASIEESGFDFPKRRVVLNLSPASVKKRGTGLDLAMALAVIAASSSDSKSEREVVAWGELGLDGSVKSAPQLLRTVYASWKSGISRLIVSSADLPEALGISQWLESLGTLNSPLPMIFGARTLSEAWDHATSQAIRGQSGFTEFKPKVLDQNIGSLLPISPSLERTLCVATVGAHHLLFLGPKGVGKSHAVEWIQALQPRPEPKILIEHALMTELQGVQISIPSQVLRKVSCHVRPASLIGSANHGYKPGEFGLAHGGLLIADEFPEWARDCREVLREPLESGKITLTRTQGSLEIPARFRLVANGNFCPCGGWPEQIPKPKASCQACRCTPAERRQYLKRLSGPILDRIDLVSIVSQMERKDAAERNVALLREKIACAQERLVKSWGALPGELSPKKLEAILAENPKWLKPVQSDPSLSLRSQHKILRVALSLAAWDEQEAPRESHWTESSYYRPERLGLFFNI